MARKSKQDAKWGGVNTQPLETQGFMVLVIR